MKETGMLFNGAMVRALLDGRKTQTRRIVKGQEFWGDAAINARPIDGGLWRIEGATQINPWLLDNSVTFVDVKSPFGQVGDRIWVRETFALSVIDPDGGPPEDAPENYDVIYREGDQPDGGWTDSAGNKISAPWKPSLHMPRWASRITLEITDVRIERLHDISEADSIAEGIELTLRGWKSTKYEHVFYTLPVMAFQDLWESTGGDWNANPWVWVIEFKQIKTGAAA